MAGQRHLEVDLDQPEVGRVAVESVHADDEVRLLLEVMVVGCRVAEGVVQRELLLLLPRRHVVEVRGGGGEAAYITEMR